jgi:spore coat polysaccharide biosynthesis protein SpsF (cytidylyltransferase family)
MRRLKIIALVQARLDSTRLPRKIVRPLAGYPMLYQLCERLQRTPSIHKVVVIAPQKNKPYLQNLVPAKVQVLGPRTHEDDLVRRHLMAAQYCHADIIVRVPSDNPCVDPEHVEEAIASYRNFPWIFYSNTSVRLNTGVWLDGVGAEVFSYSRLQWLDRMATTPAEREHPHLVFQELGLIPWYADWKATGGGATLRLDVNTMEDYAFINDVYQHFGHNRFTTQYVLECPLVKDRLYAQAC